jgi:putative FmdB family regulatory protein
VPLYEYRCSHCSIIFERLERVSTKKRTECPKCGGSALRLVGAPALHFKGSGWYVTDYGRGGGRSGRESPRRNRSTTSSSNSSK